LGAPPNIGGGFLHFRRLFLPLCVQERTGLGKNVGKKWGTTFDDETRNAPICVRLPSVLPSVFRFFAAKFCLFAHGSPDRSENGQVWRKNSGVFAKSSRVLRKSPPFLGCG